MSPIITTHIIILWFCCQNSCEGKCASQNFARNDRFLNKTITELSTYSTPGYQSRLDCSVRCSQNKDCVSFFYNSRSGQCTGHAVQFYTNESASPDEGSVYYTRHIDKQDCAEILEQYPDSPDGVYIINPLDGKGHFRVYCDMATDGGGWTVFQRRQDGSGDFFRNWNYYKIGFGTLAGEFWLGNDNINRLTTSRPVQLRIHLVDHENNLTYATYSTFRVENEADNYRLTVGGYSGTIGNHMEFHNGMEFTTKDSDNDERSYGNCAVDFTGAWWYKDCHAVNLNGRYGDTEYGKGINWMQFNYSYQGTQMMLKHV